MKRNDYAFTAGHILRYVLCLQERERVPATIEKYLRALSTLLRWLDGRPLTKAVNGF